MDKPSLNDAYKILHEFSSNIMFFEGISRISRFYHAPQEVLVERLRQAIIADVQNEFLKIFPNYHSKKSRRLSVQGKKISIHLLPNGKINLRIKFSQWLYNIYEFSCFWLLGLAGIVLGWFQYRDRSKKYGLVIGAPPSFLEEIKDKENFDHFRRGTKIDLFKQDSHFIVEGIPKGDLSKNALFSEDVTFTKFALLKWLQVVKISKLNRFYILAIHFYAFAKFVFFAITIPRITLLSRDFALHDIILELNTKSPLAFLAITNTNYSRQETWIRVLDVERDFSNMIHYSQNSIPHVREPHDYVVAPLFKQISISTHWVWTEQFKLYMENTFKCSTVIAVGPVFLFHSSRRCENIALDDFLRSFYIIYFDITPVSKNVEEATGVFDNYLSSENMQKTLKSLSSVRNKIKEKTGRDMQLVLKTKTDYISGYHCSSYQSLVQSLAATGDIALIDARLKSADLCNLNDNSVAVVGVPFTTAVQYGLARPKKRFHYDVTGKLMAMEQFLDAEFVSGEDDLFEKLSEIFESQNI